MHLNQTEYKAILSAIQQMGFDKNQILFRKKGGWIKIQLEGITELFQFHRKKITKIVEGRFKDHYQYRIKINGVVRPVDSWHNILSEFDTWLSEIKHS